MSEHEHKHDPWADLADTLGAKPVSKPSEPLPAASAPPPAARPPQKQRADKPAAPPRSDWGGLESALGLPPAPQGAPASSGRPQPPAQPARSQPSAAQASREAVEPPPSRREREQDDFSFGDRRPVAERAPRQDREVVDKEPRGSRDDEQGEGRGRRRRGRRGGRGRGGRREEGREDRPAREDRPSLERRDDEQAAARWPATAGDGDPFDRSPSDREHPLREGAELAVVPSDPAGDGDGESRREPRAEGDSDGDGGPRRRRRRGRRGGRRRGRGGDREGDVVAGQPDRAGGEASRDDGDFDDEPLPSGYGVRPATKTGESGRADGSRPEGGESGGGARTGDGEGGESGGRRRRRRRRGEGRGRDARGTAATAEAGREGSTSRRSADTAGRRSRRGRRGDERRSASTLDRGRRDEFAPVAGGREEDDEGLEFLGVEDASHDGRHHADDDSIIESGLNEVLDVPSWVEAIGIVIAGNLDARSRSPRSGGGGGGGGDGDRGRGESRGDSSSRGGDRRRGGR